MDKDEKEKLLKAGKIAKEAVVYARSIAKKDTHLLELAENIEKKIRELGGRPAFPVNLSINEVAAHATPAWNDTAKAHGLLKIDIGVHVDGYVADTALSVDLENSEENKRLIEAAEAALDGAVALVKEGVALRTIGAIIAAAIEKRNFQVIHNLSGHSIEPWNLHAGITIPNYDTLQETPLEEGVYAIEPFATNGLGSVRDGRPSGIYALEKEGNVRDSFAREVLAFIQDEYDTLPFCSRWLCKKFGSRTLIALQRLKEAGIIHEYAQLVETGNGKVAQAEHTLILTKKEVLVSTG